jgi:hypothetical protein
LNPRRGLRVVPPCDVAYIYWAFVRSVQLGCYVSPEHVLKELVLRDGRSRPAVSLPRDHFGPSGAEVRSSASVRAGRARMQPIPAPHAARRELAEAANLPERRGSEAV